MRWTENQSEANRRRLHIAAAALALVGLADAIYLTVEHLLGETAGCVVTKGCSEVLSSKYATIGNVPLAAVGALAYFGVFSLAVLAALKYASAESGLTLLVQGMLGVTLWLLLLQAFVLHAFCDYCLISAAITILLTLITLSAQLLCRHTA